MSPYEMWLAKQELNEEGVPQWLCEPGLFARSEEDIYSELKALTNSVQLRALRKALWLLLQHRFQAVPRYWENQMIGVTDPKRLLAAFRKALIVERIEDLRI